MDVVIETSDPDHVNAAEIHRALEVLGYFVNTVTIRDSEKEQGR